MTPRVRRTLWALAVVAVLSTGALTTALGAEPDVGAGLAVAGSALLLAASTFLAVRILLVVGRAASGDQPPGH